MELGVEEIMYFDTNKLLATINQSINQSVLLTITAIGLSSDETGRDDVLVTEGGGCIICVMCC